jgi:hypothetical protein
MIKMGKMMRIFRRNLGYILAAGALVEVVLFLASLPEGSTAPPHPS